MMIIIVKTTTTTTKNKTKQQNPPPLWSPFLLEGFLLLEFSETFCCFYLCNQRDLHAMLSHSFLLRLADARNTRDILEGLAICVYVCICECYVPVHNSINMPLRAIDCC